MPGKSQGSYQPRLNRPIVYRIYYHVCISACVCVWLCNVPQLQRVSEESPELLAQSGDLLVGITAQFANSSQRIARQATSILVTLGNVQFWVPTGQWALCYQIHPLTTSELSPFFGFRPRVFLFLSCFFFFFLFLFSSFFPLSLKSVSQLNKSHVY